MRQPPSSLQRPKSVVQQQVREVSHSYVLMVQHLIERCLLLYMDHKQCARALAKHARVKPVITLTVWRELEKENPEFFEMYSRHRADREARSFGRLLEDATARLCAQKLAECTTLLRDSGQPNHWGSAKPVEHMAEIKTTPSAVSHAIGIPVTACCLS